MSHNNGKAKKTVKKSRIPTVEGELESRGIFHTNKNNLSPGTIIQIQNPDGTTTHGRIILIKGPAEPNGNGYGQYALGYKCSHC